MRYTTTIRRQQYSTSDESVANIPIQQAPRTSSATAATPPSQQQQQLHDIQYHLKRLYQNNQQYKNPLPFTKQSQIGREQKQRLHKRTVDLIEELHKSLAATTPAAPAATTTTTTTTTAAAAAADDDEDDNANIDSGSGQSNDNTTTLELAQQSLQGTYQYLFWSLVSKKRDIDSSFALLKVMRKQQVTVTAAMYNRMIASLVKQRRDHEAQIVLLSMQQDRVAYDSETFRVLIEWRCERDQLKEAHTLLRQLLHTRLYVHDSSYTQLIQRYYAAERFDDARLVLVEVVRGGYTVCEAAFVLVVEAYCQQQEISSAVWLVEQVRERTPGTALQAYNAIIRACCKTLDMERAESVVAKMVASKVEPNAQTKCLLLRGYTRAQDHDAASRIFADLSTDTSDHSLVAMAFGELLCLLAEAGMADKARNVMERMLQRNMQPSAKQYGILQRAYLFERKPEQAERQLFDLVRRGEKPNIVMFHQLINYYLHNSVSSMTLEQRFDNAARLLHAMKQLNVKPSNKTYNLFLSACAKDGQIDMLSHYVHLMQLDGLALDQDAYDSLVLASCRRSDPEQAMSTIVQMQHDGIVPLVSTFNRVLHCCLINDDIVQMQRVLVLMNDSQTPYSEPTYHIIIQALLSRGDISGAAQTYHNMIANGIAPQQPLQALASEYNLIK
jgi:pentatricopeptide repeat protein